MRRRLPGRFAPVVFGAAFRAAFGVTLAVAVAATPASGAAPTGQGAEHPACSVPPEIVEAVPSLPNLAAAIRQKATIRGERNHRTGVGMGAGSGKQTPRRNVP